MSYESVVLADSPTLLWMLDETSGTAAADATGNGHAGTYSGTYTQGVTGPAGVDAHAVTVSGGSGLIYQNASQTSPDVFSIEFWFNTTSNSQVIGGFGSAQSGIPGTSDREIYMNADGTVGMYVYNNGSAGPVQQINTSGTAYNDGAWHYLAATFSKNTTAMFIYIDGAQKATTASAPSVVFDYTGYWLCGADNKAIAANPPASSFFTGSLSAFAIYPAVLTSTQVSNHYNAASGPAFLAPPNPPRGQAVNRASTY